MHQSLDTAAVCVCVRGGQCINPWIQRPCVCVCVGGGGVNALILGYSGRVCVCVEGRGVNALILGYM